MRMVPIVLMWLALAASTAEAQTVFISELLVGNDRSLCDSFGDDPDWVELRIRRRRRSTSAAGP